MLWIRRLPKYTKSHLTHTQCHEVICMMKLICLAAGIAVAVITVSIAPDVSRYLRIRSM